MLRKFIFGIVLLAIAYSCLEPYNVNIDGYDNLLVVDGLITNENKSHTIELRRSTTSITESSPYESGAVVFVTDDKGEQYYFAEFGPGVYKSDSTNLIVSEGDKLTLHIQTSDGNKYQSSECEILPKTEISNVYYKKNTAWDQEEENQNEGISIYVDGSASQSAYVRWMYEEDWKFMTPYPERYAYTDDEILISLPIENYICWKTNQSNNINVYSFSDQIGGEITNKEINFIPSDLSDRLTMRYSVLVKQLTISQEEYEYWRKLAESTEEVGDVFGKQPFSLRGNVFNVNNESEPVMGYFQTGSVLSKRIYIDYDEILKLDIPLYNIYENCNLDTFFTDEIDYPTPYDIYVGEVQNGNFKFYEPVYGEMGFNVVGLLLSNPICSDCSLRGVTYPPAFWEE
ncbi:DUF4249 domain-containing protein [Carboxylicivirga linearis]|uniref:DUF4249 domain-containing protein n=1 Tax=Carboxylicivirga linearis TaxID=1628157 RepID=A0ABS5JUU8_9BACT|nr:DUF4249 domain-containing protein [Carboxylicivirga linearis]MBS2098672.1 DUF4249 domain-containing protein [Carboxylicivirga linearis]